MNRGDCSLASGESSALPFHFLTGARVTALVTLETAIWKGRRIRSQISRVNGKRLSSAVKCTLPQHKVTLCDTLWQPPASHETSKCSFMFISPCRAFMCNFGINFHNGHVFVLFFLARSLMHQNCDNNTNTEWLYHSWSLLHETHMCFTVHRLAGQKAPTVLFYLQR